MSFLNPLLLLGAIGVGLPILAHLLNRYQVKRTDWAAMRILNQSVRVRSRQLRLKDVLLLLLRCLAILLLVLAISRPVLERAGGGTGLVGESRTGVVIALDASFSMQHKEGGSDRFDQAMQTIDQIAGTLRPGDPVTLCMLGGETRVIARNMAFDPEAFEQILHDQKPTDESLDLDGVPGRLKELASELKAPQKEVYIVTDLQRKDWAQKAAGLDASLKDLARSASVFIVPVEGGDDNLAITDLELVSGVLRRGTSARYRATVHNYGQTTARNVRVSGLVNNISMDVKSIAAIEPGTSQTVSLFLTFRDAGPMRIAAEIGDDGLAADNIRRTVAVIRDRVSVLCVQGASDQAADATELIAQALQARSNQQDHNDLAVQVVHWIDLPAQDLKTFDVVVLADVPDITPEQARTFEQFVRGGHGLIWFGGDHVKADVWNEHAMVDGTRLLPGVIGQVQSVSDAQGIGRPLDPTLPDHAVTRPLRSLPGDLLSETRFRKVLDVQPLPTSTSVLSLSGGDSPVLLEQALGRGHVFMFATSAGPAWNNMAVTPVFPMVLQQMVTYLTAREYETPRQVGEALTLTYDDRPDTADAVFDTPSGDTVNVPVRDYRNQFVAVLHHAQEVGFYQARVNLHAEARPIAVNVDTGESDVKCLPIADARARLGDTGVTIASSQMDLLADIQDARTKRSLWREMMLAALAMLVIEGLFADWLARRASRPAEAAQPAAEVTAG